MRITLRHHLAAWRRFVTFRRPIPEARFPAPSSVAQDLLATDALDRSTAWPTHRIRCVLHNRGGEPG